MLKTLIISVLLLFYSSVIADDHKARFIQTPYKTPNVVYDFYFDNPEKINSALFWIRSLIMPLEEAPYNMSADFMNIKVVIHGTEIVTVVKKNYEKYKDAVERMRYYHEFGIEFKVCNLAATDYDYKQSDFYEFIDVVPSAFTELVHWQMQGYALITPKILTRTKTVEELR
jgi:intracellular sulfur oxidation DsrE/DsrF family protein